MKKNRMSELLAQLPPAVKNVISKVIEAESEKLHLKNPHGIINEIKQIVQKEVKKESEN